MQSIKNYFRFQKLSNYINQIIQVSEFCFIKQSYFQNVLCQIDKIPQTQRTNFTDFIIKLSQKHAKKSIIFLRILFIIHEILRSCKIVEIKKITVNILFSLSEILKNSKPTSSLDLFIKQKFCILYIKYLRKAYENPIQEEITSRLQQKNSLGQNDSNNLDFSIFNKISEILKFNGDLHQMGRFYSNHQEIINLYLEFLKDLKLDIWKINQKISLISKNLQNTSTEISPQISLYLIQSQRALSSITSFYYNKYLYPYITDKIQLNLTLTIPSQLYPKILNTQRTSRNYQNFKTPQTFRSSCISECLQPTDHSSDTQQPPILIQDPASPCQSD